MSLEIPDRETFERSREKLIQVPAPLSGYNRLYVQTYRFTGVFGEVIDVGTFGVGEILILSAAPFGVIVNQQPESTSVGMITMRYHKKGAIGSVRLSNTVANMAGSVTVWFGAPDLGVIPDVLVFSPARRAILQETVTWLANNTGVNTVGSISPLLTSDVGMRIVIDEINAVRSNGTVSGFRPVGGFALGPLWSETSVTPTNRLSCSFPRFTILGPVQIQTVGSSEAVNGSLTITVIGSVEL